MLLLGFITALCSASFIEKRSDDGGRPGQVHLAYYNETVRSVSWITFENVTQYLYVKEVSDKKLKVSSQKQGSEEKSLLTFPFSFLSLGRKVIFLSTFLQIFRKHFSLFFLSRENFLPTPGPKNKTK